jgi:Uma2 family endonuclease
MFRIRLDAGGEVMTESHAGDGSALLTIGEYRSLPDEPGWRTELVRGMLVRSPGPGPRHGEVATNIVHLLVSWKRSRGAGKVLSGGTGFVLERGPDTVRSPDVSWIPNSRVPGDRLSDAYLEGAPDLAVEIVSPSNRPGEMKERLASFFAAGCREAWVVDPRRRSVTVHRADGSVVVLSDGDELSSELLPGFRCAVAEFFGLQ